MSKTEPPTRSWRDLITIHEACDLFPPMTPDELAALGEQIRQHGLPAPVVWWTELETDVDKTPAPQYQLIGGRDMLDAMELVGIKAIHFNGREWVFHPMVLENFRFGEGTPKINPMTGATTVERTDPLAFALSAVLRRHLSPEQKRELITRVLKMRPGQSNRQIAKQIQVDDKTVAAVRGKLEATAEIPQLPKTVGADGKARTAAPTRRARRTADALVLEILERDQIAPGYALAVARGIAAKLADFPDVLKRETTAPDAHA